MKIFIHEYCEHDYETIKNAAKMNLLAHYKKNDE